MADVDGIFRTPLPTNEPIRSYAPGSTERALLQAELDRQAAEVIEIPCVVGGERIWTERTVEVTMPCAACHVLARACLATPELIKRAIDVGVEAQRAWAATPWQDRVAVFLKAADLLAGPWRQRINASTMLGQGKTSYQAEIDSSCEIIDFWRYNAHYAEQLLRDQPVSSAGVWNRMDMRPLEGVVLAVTPFNFTSIAYNLPTAPIMVGNASIWKPATTQLHSAWNGMQLLEEAGLPPGILGFLPGRGAEVGEALVSSPHLSGLHFTGSTATFHQLWGSIANNLSRYRSYPRIVGETGGKDFILAHKSADQDALVTAIIRGAYEYQGQKCSAASRIYIPRSMWPSLSERLQTEIARIKLGDVREWDSFMGAVIDRRAFIKHQEYQELGRRTGKVLAGGGANSEVGWFVEPTLIEVDDPAHRLMTEEIFGPVLTAFVYEDARWAEVLEQVDRATPYALTGAVFAQDRYAIVEATGALRNAAGNFYINDKPTGAVVGQQPFGGGRASGTNDKAGSVLNLMRWVSPHTIKECFVPPTSWRYPYLG